MCMPVEKTFRESARMENVLPLVSVLIPAHNEAETLAVAVESALFQKTTFGIEIIIIDDGSRDETLKIATGYADCFDNVRVISNKTCVGKGQSVLSAYNSARGKYVHILDGDDLFSNWEKLQYQVELLEKHDDFFAVGHNTLCISADGSIRVTPEIPQDKVYEYLECCSLDFYCHTSSCLFRRIKEGLPDYFARDTMRGDTAFFFYHAFYWKKSFYVMSKVMSIYAIHGKGIWSGLDDSSKAELNDRILLDLQNLIVQDKAQSEFLLLEKKRQRQKEVYRLAEEKTPIPMQPTLDDVIERCGRAAALVFRQDVKDKAFQGMYSLPVIDSSVETVGRAIAMRHSIKLVERNYDAKKAVLLVSGFVPGGGGIFKEITEIVAALLARDFEVVIISTGKIETASSIIDTHFNHPSIRSFKADTSLSNSGMIDTLQTLLLCEAADRIYPFLTHHDVIGFATLQRGFARKIIFDFVYDHGLSLGIHTSSIDTVVTKNSSQASALAPTVRPEKLAMLAPFFTDRSADTQYIPRKNNRFTTASAAARAYKVDTEYKYSYYKIIVQVMKKLDAHHIHYGPLPDAAKTSIATDMKTAGLASDQFTHIPWADNFGTSLLEQGVDVFIAPFPICSARIGIEVMSCGIPSINHKSNTPSLPEAGDFVEPSQPSWYKPADLVATLCAMDQDTLTNLSQSARQFFCEQNAAEVSLEKFCIGAFDAPKINDDHAFQMSDLASMPFYDGDIHEAFGRDAPTRNKFWHKGPMRRKIRTKYHRFKKKHVL